MVFRGGYYEGGSAWSSYVGLYYETGDAVFMGEGFGERGCLGCAGVAGVV